MLNRTYSNKQLLAVCALVAFLTALIALPASFIDDTVERHR